MMAPVRELMPIITDALSRGQTVRMTVRGASMRPFIADGDTVDIAPLDSPVAVGDIVLAQSTASHWVLHRVVEVAGDRFFLRGDAQRDAEGPLFRDQLAGRVARSPKAAPLIWVYTAPFGYYMLRIADGIRGIGRRALRQVLKWS